MTKNEIEVKFPMTKDIWELVVTTATSEENFWVKNENRSFFVLVYPDNDSYNAMTARISGILKVLIQSALGSMFEGDNIWKMALEQAYTKQKGEIGEVVMATSYGAIATFRVDGNTTVH